MVSTSTILMIVGSTLLAALGSYYMKKGAPAFNLNPIKQLKNSYLILGGLFFFLGSVVYVVALKGENLSILYPITSISYIWVAIIAKVFLKERLSYKSWIGILLIIIGITVLKIA